MREMERVGRERGRGREGGRGLDEGGRGLDEGGREGGSWIISGLQ